MRCGPEGEADMWRSHATRVGVRVTALLCASCSLVCALILSPGRKLCATHSASSMSSFPAMTSESRERILNLFSALALSTLSTASSVSCWVSAAVGSGEGEG